MRFRLLLLGLTLSVSATADPISLPKAVELALDHDPRITERESQVDVAKAMREEVDGHVDWRVESNAFVGMATKAQGNLFKGGTCDSTRCELRDDRYDIDGISPWFHASVAVIKPLYTFGKRENYSEAADANIRVKHEDVRLQRGQTILDVKKAYYGYLAARDSRLVLEDVEGRLQKAIDKVQTWLDNGEGDVKQSDLYALQSGKALAAKYRYQAEALEQVALDGLKVVTGIGLDKPLEVEDTRLKPVALPELSLEELQNKALEMRPEMTQVKAGLKARRALVEAEKADNKPNLYAGVVGSLSYAPGRDRLNNPFLYDPFNDAGVTPVVGLQWKWSGGVRSAKTHAAEAQLNAVIAQSSLARQGIPFQVAEQYHQVQGQYEAVHSLETASRSARRWMVASYTDFEAGLEKAEKVMTALQGYVLATTDYIQTTFDYNMRVAQLDYAVGAIP